MKITAFRAILVVVMWALGVVTASAQNFTTHAVKEGETLESIAKQYKISVDAILNYNKEVKKGVGVKPNTILVIPAASKETNTSVPSVTVNGNEAAEQEEQVKPIAFISHKVKRKETLFGIAQEYHISTDDIKKYNKELYASQLDKGMRLRIPKYPKVLAEENTLNPEDFEVYVVQPKETRWSIAYKYGITIDSLLVLNPELPKANNELKIGQELQLPKIKGSTIEQQDVQLFESYTVPKAVGFYRIEKEFGVSSEELMKLNPEIKERGGLKEGMVLRIPKKKEQPQVVNTDNFIFYEVKPKETEFRLTRKFGLEYSELLALNPDLKEGLKAGMILKLPKGIKGNFEVNNALVLDRLNLLDSVKVENRPNIIVMLPFRTDIADGKSDEQMSDLVGKRKDMNYSLGIYSGILVALDSIKKLGVSVNVKTFDTERNSEKVKSILFRENLSNVNAIIGPLDPSLLKEVAVQAAAYQVPVVAPMASESDLSLNNVFFSVPTDTILRDRMLSYASEKRVNENIIIIADKKHKAVSDKIKATFPLARIVEVKEDDENISISIDKFSRQLSPTVENWVFVESDNFKLISSVSSILNSAITDKVKVKMFTTNRGKAFENDKLSSVHLSNLNFTYPSVYREGTEGSFAKLYMKRFGTHPDRFATRGFDVAYDLLLKLAYKTNLFEVSNMIGETEYTENKFSYNKNFSSGYHNKASYIMRYDNMWVKEIEEKSK